MNKVLGSWVLALFAMVLVLGSSAAFGQGKPAIVPNQMDTILYGAAYYPEYMPYDRLEEDAKLMQQAGINVVRVGEFSWGLWSRRTAVLSLPGWTAWWTACRRPASR